MLCRGPQGPVEGVEDVCGGERRGFFGGRDGRVFVRAENGGEEVGGVR